MEDLKAVKRQSLDNARNALVQAFANIGYINSRLDDGVIRYEIKTPNGVDDAYEDIEKNGYIILDEDEDGNWIEAIPPNRLNENLNKEEMLTNMVNDVQQEIDAEIIQKMLDALKEDESKLELKRLKNKYYKWKSWMKNPPCAIDVKNLATFEEWKKNEQTVT